MTAESVPISAVMLDNGIVEEFRWLNPMGSAATSTTRHLQGKGVVRVGTPVEHLQAIVNLTDKFKTSAFIEANGILKEVELTCDQRGKFIHLYIYRCPGVFVYDHFRALTVEEAFRRILSSHPGGKVYLASLIVRKNGKSALPWSKVYRVARDVWATTLLGDPATHRIFDTPASARNKLLASYQGEFKNRMLGNLISGRSGVVNWNAAVAEVPEQFRGVYWTESELAGLDLCGVRMDRLTFSGSNFSGANLEKSSFGGAVLVKANFRSANMESAILKSVSADCADFSRASLIKASLVGADLRNCSFHQADLSVANLSYSMLHGADLTTATLTGAILNGAQYENLDSTRNKTRKLSFKLTASGPS